MREKEEEEEEECMNLSNSLMYIRCTERSETSRCKPLCVENNYFFILLTIDRKISSTANERLFARY